LACQRFVRREACTLSVPTRVDFLARFVRRTRTFTLSAPLRRTARRPALEIRTRIFARLPALTA
jgi:hypothetical protein